MSGRRIVGVVCLLLSAMAFVAGVGTISRDPALNDPMGLGVSRAVGTFLPGIVFAAIAAWCFQKPKQE